jgi:hypothetical protein
MVKKFPAVYVTLMFNWRVSTYEYITIYGETVYIEVLITRPLLELIKTWIVVHCLGGGAAAKVVMHLYTD